MRERELDDSGQGWFKRFLPDRVTVQGIRDRIRDPSDFRRIVGYRSDVSHHRYSELTRVLKSVDPHALDVARDDQMRFTTPYAEREEKLNRQAVRRQRAKTREDMSMPLYEGDEGIDFGSLTAPEYHTVTSDNDLLDDDEGEPDDTDLDVDEDTLKRWRQEDARTMRDSIMPDAMYEVYRDTWTDPRNMHNAMPGYQKLLDALDWLAEKRIRVLNKMFASGRDEIDPQYITESGGIRNPYVNISYETRHNRAVKYITYVAREAGWDD